MTVKDMIIQTLKGYEGKDNPITYKDLAFLMKISDRECRELVAGIVSEGLLPVYGSSDKDKGGYFVVSTPDEYNHAIFDLTSRISHLSKRLAGFKQAWANKQGQTKLFTKEERVQDYHQKIEGLKKVIGAQTDLNLPPQEATGAAREGNMRSL